MVHQWGWKDWLHHRDDLIFISLSIEVYFLNIDWFFEKFQFWALFLGRFPQVFSATQTCSLYVPCIPCLSSLVWGVRAVLLRSLTQQMPYLHWLFDINWSNISVLILSVLLQYLEVSVSGIPRGLFQCYLFPPAITSRTLGRLGGGFVPWYNSCNMLKR